MSRRVVVAAPYPTMPGPEAAASFALVRELVEAGDDVTVVSPIPTAAHHHADPGGPRGAARLARIAKEADLLHLRLDASALGASGAAVRSLPGRIALHGVLRRARESEVRLDRVPERVSEQWASLVLGRAARITVEDREAHDALVRAGVNASRIVVSPDAAASAAPVPTTKSRAPHTGPGSEVPPSATAADLQELVRRRAIEERASSRRTAVATEGTASLPLRHLPRMERAAVRSNKPGGAFVKKAIAKVLQWQFDNVIASVNRLHQATIEAIEGLEARQAQAGDDTTR